MSDTEEVVIRRTIPAKKNTKPEIAREKLKEKRERLKKEKEEAMIEAAKVKLAAEAERKMTEEQKAKIAEEEKKKADPMYQMLQKMEAMMSMMAPKSPVEPESLKAPKPRAKKVVDPKTPKPKPEPTKPKPAPKPRAPRKKKVLYAEDSPSNVFIGKDKPPVGQQIQYEQPQEQEAVRPLLGAMLSRRNMNSAF
jgi:hypothetical protein